MCMVKNNQKNEKWLLAMCNDGYIICTSYITDSSNFLSSLSLSILFLDQHFKSDKNYLISSWLRLAWFPPCKLVRKNKVLLKALFNSVQSLSRVWLFMTPWTLARQASLSITNSRRFYYINYIYNAYQIFVYLSYIHEKNLPLISFKKGGMYLLSVMKGSYRFKLFLNL